MNAIMIDIFDATPAHLAFFSKKISNSGHKKTMASESDCTHQKKKANRTDVATPKAKGAWLVEPAEMRSID